jgi:Na+/proline symporter
LFAAVATASGMPQLLGALFFLGLLAAAFSSADSALTSLTTAFCVDFLHLGPNGSSRIRNYVYLGMMSAVLIVMIGIFQLKSDSIISTLFTAAGYTYGPLLGLFAFALTQQRVLKGWSILPVAIASPLMSFALSQWAPAMGYTIGFELLLYNGAFTYVGAWALSSKN